MHTNTKSATTAGLLGIFLGGFGAHDWYLGNKKKGLIHVLLAGAGLVLALIVPAILSASMSILTVMQFGWLFMMLDLIGWGLMSASSIWGFVEGVIILSKGDATLNPPAQVNTGNTVNGANNVVQQANNPGNSATYTYDPLNPNVTGAAAATFTTATPAPRPPKQPMNPATKKKIIIGVCAGAFVALAAVVTTVIVSVASRVDYEPAYELVQDMRPAVTALYNQSCYDVVENVSSTYTSKELFNKYIDKCLVTADGLDDMMNELGNTAAVKRNKNVREKFEKFQKSLSEALPDTKDLQIKLDMYKTWHDYVLLVKGLSEERSTDAQIKAAADVLINSSNDTLKRYGEGWLEKTMAYVEKYRITNRTSFADPNYKTLKAERDAANEERKNYIDQNCPDIKSLFPIDYDTTSTFYDYYLSLSSLITKEYDNQD